MKAALTTIFTVLLSVAGFGQGVVNFSNASSVPGWANPALDRYAHWASNITTFNPQLTPGGPIASNDGGVNLTSLRAALYYAASTDFDPSFVGYVQASGGAATFKSSTSATVGSWFGGNRTLDTIPNGTTANLVVIVWDSNLAADGLSPTARNGMWGTSSIFQYTPPTNPQAQPSDFLMTGLTGFSLGNLPEPSSFALAGLGAVIIGFRRYKCKNNKTCKIRRKE